MFFSNRLTHRSTFLLLLSKAGLDLLISEENGKSVPGSPHKLSTSLGFRFETAWLLIITFTKTKLYKKV